MASSTRRTFIEKSVKAGLAIGIGNQLLASCKNSKLNISKPTTGIADFTQKPLAYAYNALEDVIDATTMEIHYTKHAATYLKNVKDAVAELSETQRKEVSIMSLLQNISTYSTKMRNNVGGHYNHELFWQCLRPKQNDNKPDGELLMAIEKSFTSFNDFKLQFSDAAKNRFGSGWAWLYVDANKQLKIGSTPNQDNPLMNVSEIKGAPLLALDVWEHAYYLKYQNKRVDYITNFWQIVNWSFVAQQYQLASK